MLLLLVLGTLEVLLVLLVLKELVVFVRGILESRQWQGSKTDPRIGQL